MIHTYNEYHLGDNLVHLNFLRRACRENQGLEVTHHCNPAHHAQLEPLLEGAPIWLEGLSIPPKAHNAWIGRDNYFYNHPLRADWCLFHLSWFDHLSSILGISNPMACREDFLFDYPALKNIPAMHFDYFICNSVPASGQLPDFDPEFFKNMVRNLVNEGKKVITTAPTGMAECTLDHSLTVTGIGAMAKGAQHHIGVATGPMWTTFNVYGLERVKTRTWYCAHQTVNITDNTITKHRLLEN